MPLTMPDAALPRWCPYGAPHQMHIEVLTTISRPKTRPVLMILPMENFGPLVEPIQSKLDGWDLRIGLTLLGLAMRPIYWTDGQN